MYRLLNALTCNDDTYFLGLAKEAYKIMEDLFNVPRSLTGNGVRDTLKYLSNIIPLKTYGVPTGTKRFDWTIPKEWNLKRADLFDQDGRSIWSTDISNLCVLGYSQPVDMEVSLDDLLPHLYYDETRPDSIPYRTSYYKETWGLCVSYNFFKKLTPGKYQVKIDAELRDGSLTYADVVLKGKSIEEILLSTYICHPAMANDNLSGIALSTIVLRELSKLNTRYTYRGVFVPETLGAISYLAAGKISRGLTKAGLVATCVADGGEYITYKKSKQDDSEINRTVAYVLRHYSHLTAKTLEFCPYGSDERQYSSPAYDLPVGSLMRTYYYDYPQYHSSDDNLSIVNIEKFAEMIKTYLQVFCLMDVNGKWWRTDGGFGEPKLDKKNMYPDCGGNQQTYQDVEKVLWLLNMADGKHDLIDIAIKSGYDALELAKDIKVLENSGMIYGQ